MTKNQISKKKMFIMLSTELFAMTSLILPAILVGLAGKNGLPVLFAASGILFLLAAWYLTCYKRQEKSIDRAVNEKTGILKLIFKTVYVIRYFIHGLFLMIIFMNLIQEVLLPEYHFFWILLPILSLVYLMAGKQLRVRGRILEVLFPYIFVPLFIVLFLALFQLDYQSLPEQLWGTLGQGAEKNLYHGIYGILLFYQPIEFILFLLPALEKGNSDKKKKKPGYVVGAACIFVIMINVIMYVSAIGMFGTVRTGEKLWSALYIMQSVRLPGKFVERLDILFLVFWIFSAFALFSAYMYYGGRFFLAENSMDRQQMGNSSSDKRKSNWYTGIWLLGILFGALLIQKPEKMFRIFYPYKMWIDFPLSILLPGLIYKKRNKRKGKTAAAAALTVMMCCFVMTGCQDRADIEDRNYVMTIGAEKGKDKKYQITFEIADLSQSKESGGERKGRILSYEADSLKEAEEIDRIRDDKKLDYGHLKAILLKKELLETEDVGDGLLRELEQSNSIAGTTLLFFTEEELQSVIKTGEKKAPTFGEYMDRMVVNQKSKLAKEDTLSKFLRDEAEQVGKRKVCLIKTAEDQIELGTGTLNEDMTLAQLSDTVLRFHIRANSDSSQDQKQKIGVKDRILPKLQALLASAESKEESVAILESSLGLIENWVEEACEQEGDGCSSKVSICREKFPLKIYGDMVLPSGTYDALRIDLGKGEGGNWWCMMYPSLCFREGVMEPVPEEEKGEEEEKTYLVRWKIAEWFSKIIPNLS